MVVFDLYLGKKPSGQKLSAGTTTLNDSSTFSTGLNAVLACTFTHNGNVTVDIAITPPISAGSVLVTVSSVGGTITALVTVHYIVVG